MPYKDPSKQRSFQKKWIAKRRSDHFKGKHCSRCGKPVSSKTADLDHKKPQHQQDHHKIWSLKKSKRSKEISKTQILCKACHKKKTKRDIGKMHEGADVTVAKVAFRFLLEMLEGRKCKDTMPGGQADGMCDDEFDKKDLKKGKDDEEEEHGLPPEKAKEVAKDHLVKNPKEYDKK